jgi:T-complex protein 1 subunit zeta
VDLILSSRVSQANSGLDVQDAVLTMQEEHESSGEAVGLDIITGEPMLPAQEGIFDNFRVKRQSIHLSTVLATQLLLVDEVRFLIQISPVTNVF